jgi:hypothetical protein
MCRLSLSLLLSVAIHCVCAQSLQAQTTNSVLSNSDIQYYLFVSRGAVSGVKIGSVSPVPTYNAWHIGGGADWFKFKGLAISGELALTPSEIKSKPVT